MSLDVTEYLCAIPLVLLDYFKQLSIVSFGDPQRLDSTDIENAHLRHR
jgi:hypothetical protein